MQTNKLWKYSALLLLMLFFTPAVSDATIYPVPSGEEIVLSKRKWVGVWDYTVADVPPEYTNGQLHVTKSGKKYGVDLVLDFGKIPAEAVVVKSKVLYFEVNIDGMVFEITLNRDKDAISGEAASADGTFYLKGQRKV